MLELTLHVPIDQLTPHTDPSALNPHPRVGEQQLFVKPLLLFFCPQSKIGAQTTACVIALKRHGFLSENWTVHVPNVCTSWEKEI